MRRMSVGGWGYAVSLAGDRVMQVANQLLAKPLFDLDKEELPERRNLNLQLIVDTYFMILALNNFCKSIQEYERGGHKLPDPPFNRSVLNVLRNIREHWEDSLGSSFQEEINDPRMKKNFKKFFEENTSAFPLSPQVINTSPGPVVIIADAINVVATMEYVSTVFDALGMKANG